MFSTFLCCYCSFLLYIPILLLLGIYYFINRKKTILVFYATLLRHTNLATYVRYKGDAQQEDEIVGLKLMRGQGYMPIFGAIFIV